MPTTAEWLAANPDFIGSAQAGSNFVTSLYDQAKKAQDDQAQTQAGQAYAKGDYTGAATTLANTGNIPAAAQIQQQGAASNKAGLDYITKALPVLQKIAAVHAAEGPQAQAAALVGAFRHLAPEAKQLTGVSDQVLQGLEQSFASDPNGTLQRLQAMVPTELKTVGNTIVPTQGGQILTDQAYTAPGYEKVGPGETAYPTGGPQGQPGAVPSASESPPAAAGGTDPSAAENPFTAPFSKPALAQIESNNNPTAVNPKSGAGGLYQVMPSTAADPGFGVQPAQDGSPQELARVGSQLNDAWGQKYNNVVDHLVAQNWGPGNTERWIKGGRHPEQLPAETRNFILKYAIAAANGRLAQAAQAGNFAGAGASIPAFAAGSPGAQIAGGFQQPAQAQPQPPMQGGGRPILRGAPNFTPMAQAGPEAQKNFPGAIGIEASGKPMYPPANASTVADSSLEQPDSHSQSILAATGLPYTAFLTLTGQAAKLPRDKTTRSVAFKTAEDFANKRGVDVSSFSSQYDAYNHVLKNNIERYNQTRIMEGELQGTIANLKPVADAVGMGKVRLANVLEAAAGQEVNDPTVQQYRFQLQQLRAELAGYNGALQGRSGNNITDSDRHEADQVIKNGLSSGGATGLDKAVSSATQKMSGVLQTNIRLTNRAIWDLFGVGKQFDRLHPAPKPQMAQRQQGGGAKVIRYDAQGNRIQ